MTHAMNKYYLTDPITGRQYINNPGTPNHGSCSYDGVTWHRPMSDEHLARRQKEIDRLVEQSERERPAAPQDETLTNHIGNMQTPEEAAAERERQERNLKAIKELKKIVDRNTLSENMVAVLGCALFAVFLAGGTTLVVLCIDAIIKIVRAW